MFKFLIMSFYYYMKGKLSIFIRKFISILRIVWIVWRLFIKANIFIRYLIYMHSYQKLMELKTLLGFVTHPIIFQCTGSSLKAARVLEVARNLWFSFVRMYSFLLYSSLALFLYRRNQDILDPFEHWCNSEP